MQCEYDCRRLSIMMRQIPLLLKIKPEAPFFFNYDYNTFLMQRYKDITFFINTANICIILLIAVLCL